jgi:molybdate transport system ATP-binding protein
MSPFLTLREASFRLGNRLVFERTSWVFQRQEHWAVIGPNSSGKSLFADALRGGLPIVGGQLRYRFRPVPGLTCEESIGHIAFEDRKHEVHDTVLQSRWNSIEEEGALQVRDFLSYERVAEVNPFEITDRHRTMRPAFERRKRRAIELLDLAPILDRTLLSLSNGETQRVQLARTLSKPMRLLVLDEPFVGLDGATRQHFRRVLDHLMETALRVLVITTRLEDLPQSITHILCVNQCRLVAAGPRAEILSDLRVRRLLSGGPLSRRGYTARLPRPRKEETLPGSARATASAQSGTNGTFPDAPAPVPRALRPRSKTRRLVEMHDVSVRYGNAIILQNIHWTILTGQSWALLGPNGSGKTTLLSLLLGDNPQAYSNDVRVFGQPRGSGESVWQLKRRIGWVSPELHLHFDDWLSCRDVVISGFHETAGLYEPSTPLQKAAARRWLKRLQLLEFAETPLYELSAGLQRMVFLARALVKRPQLLVLDEPCQGLDFQHRALLVNAIDALIRAGEVTAIFVTHRMDEIPRSIKRVLRLSAGRGHLGVLTRLRQGRVPPRPTFHLSSYS